MQDKTDQLRAGRLRVPDPATPEESNVIGLVIKGALQALRQVRRIVLNIRPSDETLDAVQDLERAQGELEEFLQREA